MILQELVRYYERKRRDADLAPEGFEAKEIPFLIQVDDHGNFVQILDTRSGEGKKKRAQIFLVPQAVKKTSGVAANLLWDNAEYVLGLVVKGKAERVAEQHKAFRARLQELPEEDNGVRSVLHFLERHDFEALAFSPCWQEIQETNPNLSFQLVSDVFPVFEREAVIAAIRQRIAVEDESAVSGTCLVSGEKCMIERLHPSIKGVWNAQSSGANIVSFNQRAFESYGKEEKQGENAPIGKKYVFAYTTALNHLLSRDSGQRVQVGDASTVFWSDRQNPIEEIFGNLFGEPPKDDPDAQTNAVKAFYRSVEMGKLNSEEAGQTRFFVLGLAPNAARISIRFWQTGTVPEFSEHIRQYFDELKIVHGDREKPYLSLFRLLANTAMQGKSENIPPNLGGDVMRAILTGLPYPETILLSAIRRNRAEREVNYPRAALIKACLNRRARLSGKDQEELKVSLDRANQRIGYRLGRLFAVLEKTQEEAQPGITVTIRDRYYGAASSTPVTVFSTLLKLSKHHLAKIENRGRVTNLEKLLQEILSGIDGESGFPAQLSTEEQGRFAIGYYHQKQDFYTRRDEAPQGEAE